MTTRIFHLAFVAAMVAAQPLMSSELQGIVKICDGNKLCPEVFTKADPPKGWIEDESWTKKYRAKVMFEGGDHSRTKPIMYVRTHFGEKTLSLENYISVAQRDWKSDAPGTEIEPQADFVRNAKPAFKVYIYKNPTVADQQFELTAFTKDTDPSHGNATYFQQVVLSATTREELEHSRPAFEELLGKL
jgi:hypothetical protein